MGELTKLLEQHGLTTIHKIHEGGKNGRIDRTTYSLIKQAYPHLDEWVDEPHSYGRPPGRDAVWWACPESTRQERYCSHSLYHLVDGSWAYSWPGSNYVVSKQLITVDLLHQLAKTKKAELAEACKKRSEKIRSPRDAVRLTFRDLGIKHTMVSGLPRIDCGPFSVEFDASKDGDPKVAVNYIHRSSHYVNKTELTTLSIADPSFSKKLEVIAYNCANLNKLLLGEAQPKSLKVVPD